MEHSCKKVEGSAVFISISDKMLFRSGSYEITPRAKDVLGKVAAVIKAQPDVQFMVEGHTDNKAISTSNIRDNWDLSVLRSASVVRTLQKQYGVDPSRMIAAGRSEFVPLTSNATGEGRATNRRTRIVILPQLDQFFKLMEQVFDSYYRPIESACFLYKEKIKSRYINFDSIQGLFGPPIKMEGEYVTLQMIYSVLVKQDKKETKRHKQKKQKR